MEPTRFVSIHQFRLINRICFDLISLVFQHRNVKHIRGNGQLKQASPCYS